MKSGWQALLKQEKDKPYFTQLWNFLKKEYHSEIIYPPKELIFHAFDYADFDEVKVVLLGQDPYHGSNQAHGLSFSVASNDAKFPPSLRNIFKELADDVGIQRTKTDLSDWAQQGVMLLNTTLTVRAANAGSHRNQGWEAFTDDVITLLNEREKPVIFVLWGNAAKAKTALITQPQHKIITSAHPSPLSAHNGFFNSKPFSKINYYLREMNEAEIKWG
ncbi:MAG: uracil-DNA glycosylase [Streptococcaceae bacterium]|nr:uracil-DNA glycosylase [Streptococcaceae bacterium]